MVISAETTASPPAVITANGSKFQKANDFCLTVTPFCFKMVFHSRPARLAEKVKLTAPILLATAKAIAAALVECSGKSGAARTTFVRRMVAPMLVPATLHMRTPRTPMSQTVGCIWRSEARTSQFAKTCIHPWCSRPSMRIN
jgi:hypothetical protein